MNYKLIAYAQDFASFLLENLKNPDKVDSIILFGSVVRGEAMKSSDIDIFIETKLDIQKEISELTDKFYKNIRYKKYWSLLGIKNEFHVETGILNEWKSLERSLHAQGIILFGKYKSEKKGEPFYLFSIEQSKSRNKNVSVWRKLYGYKQKINKKIYEKNGLIKEYNGERIAKGSFMIPANNAQKIISFLKNNKIKYKIMLLRKEH